MKSEIEFLNPWESVDSERADQLEKELKWEICKAHVLHGKKVVFLAGRKDRDDFFIQVDGDRYAVVHLTWVRESKPEWPGTYFYKNLQEFVGEMEEDFEELPEANVLRSEQLASAVLANYLGDRSLPYPWIPIKEDSRKNLENQLLGEMEAGNPLVGSNFVLLATGAEADDLLLAAEKLGQLHLVYVHLTWRSGPPFTHVYETPEEFREDAEKWGK